MRLLSYLSPGSWWCTAILAMTGQFLGYSSFIQVVDSSVRVTSVIENTRIIENNRVCALLGDSFLAFLVFCLQFCGHQVRMF